jgi:DNA-binding transcriptional ArsR family regulator
MGWLQDFLKDVPLSDAQRERIALAEVRYDRAIHEVEGYKRRVAALELENESLTLRAQVPSEPASGLGSDTVRVLVHLFGVEEIDGRDVGAMSRELAMERGALEHHLDRLKKSGLADLTGGNYVLGHVYWALTPEGRRHVAEGKLS